jgi:hypothetical protein
VIANLQAITLTAAYEKLVQENEAFRRSKLERLAAGAFQDADFFTCWYCFNHYQKVGWLQKKPAHSWTPLIWQGV